MKFKKFFVNQQDQSDCGVSCLLSVIKYYGGNANLENLRRISGTYKTGTTLLGLHQAAHQTGFNAEGCEADIDALVIHNAPCILHIHIDSHLQHYVICFGTNKKNGILYFIIGDPAKGLSYLTRTELEQIWQSKTCLTLTPNEKFKKENDTKKEKRKWIIELIKTDSTLLTIAAFLGIAIAGLSLAMALFSQRLIDDILPKKNFTKLNLGIVLVFILLMVKESLSVLREYFLLRQSTDFNIRITDFFYTHLLKLPKPFFDTRKIGDLTARLNDNSRIQKVISQLAGNVVIDVFLTLVTTTFIFLYSWRVGIICICVIPVFYLLIYLHNKKIMDGQRFIMSGYAMAESNYISTLQGIDPIKNYNKQTLFSATNKTIYQHYQDKIFSFGKIQIRLLFLANSFGTFFLTGILLFTSYQVLHNQLKTGELIAVLGMCSSLLPSIANLALIQIPINEAKIAFDRMFEFTDIKPETGDEKNIFESMQSLNAANLSFRFAGCSPIFKDISFHVSSGEIIAIVGENGCGKSTLIQLLQKHYQFETGSITINNNLQLNDIAISAWRKSIGIVPQNIHLFNASVLENIAFEDAQTKPEKVLEFLQQYNFTPFIESLPQSYMSLLGEEGVNISGGQKQMIAIIRALYHKPQLLILDEATAAMDTHSEQFVLNLLQQLKKGMGIILITHRLHVLKTFCDRIYILENGVIATTGNHDSLLKSSNLYSKYWADLVS